MRTAAGEMPAAAFFSDLAGDLMDRECVKGFAEKTKGAIKESAGKVSGVRNWSSCKADKAKGDM
jgi:uncharacterized protein YjbJ (UPF0337 family)